MRRTATIGLAGLLLGLLPMAGVAQAHPGNGGTTMGNRLEGENYSTPDSGCDPDFDNEHTVVNAGTVQMPRSGCGVSFGTVNFQYSGSFGSFRADTWSGTGETVTSRVEVVVDGAIAASGSITRAPGAGFATVNFSSATPISAGNHTVRVQYTVTSGPSWSNLRLDYADFSTVMTQVGSKSTGTGCAQPASSTHYDVRDPHISHWLYFHVAHTPMEIKRTWVNDDTGQAWADDFQTHTGATGDWCWEFARAINGTFFQPRPGNWHVETYFKTVSGTWARVAPNLHFQVWPKRTGGGVYKNTPGDGQTSFGANEVARVYTNWSTTNAQNHTVRYKWHRPDGTEHTPGDSGLISLPSGWSSYQTTGWMDIAAAGASAYPGTWTVRTWIDDTNYMEQVHSLTITGGTSGPANDNFVNATTAGSTFNQSVSNSGATLESGEPRPCGSTGTTVWYRYTPSSSGTLTVDTVQGASYDTVLAAYTGSSVTGLTNVACNDDFSGTLSQISLPVTAGTTYRIQLGAYNGGTGGSATLRFQFTPSATPPANDNFANATTITAPYSASTTTTNATLETGESRPCGTIGSTVWYRYTPSASGTATVDTNQSAGYNSVIAAYTGSSLTALTNVACNDSSTSNTAQVTFNVTAGTTYWIQLGGNNSASGTATLRLTYTAPPAGPANDNFASATPISATPYTVTQSTANATLQSGELAPCVSAGATVWFRYTHPSGAAARRMFVDTFGSNFNTTMGVWTGSAIGAISLVSCNDDARGLQQSQTSWLASPGVTYSIQVAGIAAQTGTLKLRLVEGTLLALGDSVVAGHGVGPNPNGYPNNPTAAYSSLVGGDLNLRVVNRARTASCAWNRTSGHASTADFCDFRSILSGQLPSPYPAAEVPTHVVIGVGANDIEFATCLQGFIDNSAAQNDCKDPVIGPRLTALRSNLEEVIRRVKALSSPSPHVVVMGYYNPFSPAPSDDAKLCDVWFPATIARNQALAASHHESIGFRWYVRDVQTQGWNYSVDVLARLNGALSSAASSQGVTFVQPNFTNHDMCTRIRGGTTADTWVYGPDWNDKWVSFWTPNQSYHSRPMPGLCAYPISPYDDEMYYPYHNTDGPNFSYDMWFRPNCMVHPTTDGHRALADLVRPSLPLA